MKYVLVVIVSLYAVSIQAQPLEFSRNPFKPTGPSRAPQLVSTTGSLDDIILDSIKLIGVVWDELDPAAMIQVAGVQKVVYQNEQFQDIKINTIGQDSLAFTYQDEKFMLHLGQELQLP